MARFKVVLTDTTAPDYDLEAQVFQESGLDVEPVYLQTRDPARVLEYAVDADALVVAWAPITRPVVDRLTKCRVIARYGIGVDMIDLDAATERGILVCNTARYCLDEVSTHTVALLLMLNRGILAEIDRVRSGGWAFGHDRLPRRLHGQRLGLVGFGNIGRRVADKARGLGLEVVAHDPYLRRSHAEPPDTPLIDLDELLRTSDFVSIHCPLTAETRHLIGRRELALMKSTAFLINTARGPIVDQQALVAALRERRIAGAGLDVFEQEPLPADDPLRMLDNVILTPHSASRSVESVAECRRTAVEHVVTVLRGGIPTDVVNRAVLDRRFG